MKRTFKSAVFVPQNGLYDVLRHRDVLRAYHNFHQVVIEQMVFTEEGIKAKLFPDATIPFSTSPVVCNRNGILGISAQNNLPAQLLPSIKHFRIYFVPSDETSDLTLEFDDKRILSLGLPSLGKTFQVRTAVDTDQAVPLHEHWPQELTETFYRSILKIGGAEENHFMEVMPRTEFDPPVDVDFAELPLLIKACPVGVLLGTHWDVDYRLQVSNGKHQTVVTQPSTQLNSHLLWQPYIIVPEQVAQLLEEEGGTQKVLEEKMKELKLFDSFVRSPPWEEDATDKRDNKISFVVRLALRSGWSSHESDEFKFPYATSAAEDSLVKSAMTRIKRCLNEHGPIQVMCYRGDDDRSFVLKMAACLQRLSIPLIWLKYHLYLDRHQGGTQMYLQRAFEAARKQRGVIMIHDADAFFSGHDKKYGRSTFLSLVHSTKAGVCVIMTAPDDWQDDAINGIVTM